MIHCSASEMILDLEINRIMKINLFIVFSGQVKILNDILKSTVCLLGVHGLVCVCKCVMGPPWLHPAEVGDGSSGQNEFKSPVGSPSRDA